MMAANHPPINDGSPQGSFAADSAAAEAWPEPPLHTPSTTAAERNVPCRNFSSSAIARIQRVDHSLFDQVDSTASAGKRDLTDIDTHYLFRIAQR